MGFEVKRSGSSNPPPDHIAGLSRFARPALGSHLPCFATKNLVNFHFVQIIRFYYGGEGGIRTHVTLADNPVFKTGAINRSATSP